MFYTRYVTWCVRYSTQDHQKSSLFNSVTAISLQMQHEACAWLGVPKSVCGQCIQLRSVYGSSCMFYTRCVTWCVLCSTQDHQKSSLFTSVTACYFAAGAACDMIETRRINIGVWPMYTAGIDLGQLMHVLYPLCNLMCTIFNSRPSEELTFHLSYNANNALV